MKKKITVLTLCAMLFALCGSVDAQQSKKVSRVGFIAWWQERTEAEYRTLYAAAGFELARVIPTAITDKPN